MSEQTWPEHTQVCEKCRNALKAFDDCVKAVNITDFDRYCNALIKQRRHCFGKKTHKGNGVYKGAYAFTLTKSPKDELTQEQMILAAQKLMKQKSCPVKKYAFYLEKAGEEHCHIHGMYETFTEGRIEAKHFKRVWPIWDEKKSLGAGFRGGYHRPIRAEEAYSEYIAKDGGFGESNIPT